MKFFKKVFTLIIHRIVIFIAYISPTYKNKICMISYYGSGFNDSPKYIAESILKINKKAKIFFGISHKNINKYSSHTNLVFCDTSSVLWFYHLLTSRVWVDNCRKTIKTKKKKTLYINTWHGGGLQKKIEADAIDSLDEEYVNFARRDSSMIDIMISDSAALSNLYRKSFWYSGLILEIGLPRYAPLICNAKGTALSVKKDLNIPEDKRIILYAPTFRNKNELFNGISEVDKIIKECSNKFNGDFCFLIKLHPNIADFSFQNDTDSFLNVSKYENTQELLVATDVLISDYSSIIYDFSILRRPSFRLITDLTKYDRGLYFDVNRYPWPLAKNESELQTLICEFDLQKYINDLNEFDNFLGFVCVKHPEEVCAKIICDYLDLGLKKKKFLKKLEKDYG